MFDYQRVVYIIYTAYKDDDDWGMVHYCLTHIVGYDRISAQIVELFRSVNCFSRQSRIG